MKNGFLHQDFLNFKIWYEEALIKTLPPLIRAGKSKFKQNTYYYLININLRSLTPAFVCRRQIYVPAAKFKD